MQNYEVERLFSTHLGDTTYAVSIEQTASRPAKHLYVSATGHDRDDACRYIKIVNISDSPVDVTLEIARGLAGLGASPSRPVRLEVTTLNANPTAKTTIGYRGEASGAIVPERRAYTAVAVFIAGDEDQAVQRHAGGFALIDIGH